MNLYATLSKLHDLAAKRLRSRSPTEVRAACRIKRRLFLVSAHVASNPIAERAVQLALEAALLLIVLETRRSRQAKRRRARQLRAIRPEPARKFSDDQLREAIKRTPSKRAAARRLKVSPSTVTKRLQALPSVTRGNSGARL